MPEVLPSTRNQTEEVQERNGHQQGSNFPSSKILSYKWMLRPCSIYHCEYKDCKSLRDRFHQYWVQGKFRDCTQLKTDHYNCLKWEEKHDSTALAEVIESEIIRVRSRLRAHAANDVWEDRECPPADWTKELPSHIQAEYKGTFLQFKADELREGLISLDNEEKEFIFTGTRCCIV